MKASEARKIALSQRLHESTKYPNWPIAGEIPRISGRPASKKEIEMVNDMLSKNDEISEAMEKVKSILFGDINSVLYFIEPGTVTLIKVPRKLKKKMKKEGTWNKPVKFEADSLLSHDDLHLIFKGNK